jgi:hypothetical protein
MFNVQCLRKLRTTSNNLNLGHVPNTQNVLNADFDKIASIGEMPEPMDTSLLGHIDSDI